MAGIASLLFALSGQPDPERQLAAALSGQQQPGQQPPAADPSAAGGPGPAQQPPAQPTPQAYVSPPDLQSANQQLASPPNLVSLMLQMDRVNRAEEGFNRGLAGIVANHSLPSMRQSIMQSMTGGGADAGTMMGNVMSLYQTQQGMAAQQDMLRHAPDYDTKLNLPPGTARDMIMAGRGSELVGQLMPPTIGRDYNWARQTYAANHPGATPDEIDQGAQGILMGAGGMGGGDAATKSWRMAKIQWDQNPATKGTPYPWGAGADDNPTRFQAWSGGQVEQDKVLSADQTEASRLGPTYRENLQGARDRIASIIGVQSDGSIDPAREARLKQLLGHDMAQKYINADPTKGTMDQDVATFFGQLDPEDRSLLTSIRDATDPNTLLGGLNKRAPKRGQADVADIGVGFGGIRNVTQGYDDWMGGAKKTLKALDTATMNSFGAQGTPEAAEDYAVKHHIPADEALPLMDDNYVYGGSMYPKGKIAGAMTQPQIAAATSAIKKADDPEAERQRQIKLALVRNIDPKPLKDLRL